MSDDDKAADAYAYAIVVSDGLKGLDWPRRFADELRAAYLAGVRVEREAVIGGIAAYKLAQSAIGPLHRMGWAQACDGIAAAIRKRGTPATEGPPC